MRRIRAVVYGMGAMGCLSSRLLLEKGVEIVGALARSPHKVGRDVGDVAGLGHSLNVPVESDADAVLSRHPDIVLLCTKSFLPEPLGRFCSRVRLTQGVRL
jgi:2,4-diaminopentanoate dehydrogenase